MESKCTARYESSVLAITLGKTILPAMGKSPLMSDVDLRMLAVDACRLYVVDGFQKRDTGCYAHWKCCFNSH